MSRVLQINATRLNATARNHTVQAMCDAYVRAKQSELQEQSALTAGAGSEETLDRLGLDRAAAKGTAECPFTSTNTTAAELNPVRQACGEVQWQCRQMSGPCFQSLK
jgi:hypothetical protein